MKRNRFKSILLEAELGIEFSISSLTDGVIKISAKNAPMFETNAVIAEPPLPVGYKWHKGGASWIIERISDGSLLTWIHVETLKDNAYRNGGNGVKFGIRNWKNSSNFANFSDSMSKQFEAQIKSVEKYGGFYVSCYNISLDSNGNPVSKKGKKPIVGITYTEALAIGTAFESGVGIKSHLMFGSEYDCMLEWLLESEAKTYEEIAENSQDWGNYSRGVTQKTFMKTDENDDSIVLGRTGENRAYAALGIYDIAGNVSELTQERYKETRVVLRGGSYLENGVDYCAAHREPINVYNRFEGAGMRVALTLD